MKKLLIYLKPYTKETVISPFFKLLEAIFDLLVPLVVKQIIDVGIANRDKPYILGMCAILILFAIIGLTCSLIAQYFAAKAAVGFSTELRRDLFSHIQSFSYAQTDRIGTSTLITRMTADVNQVQSAVNLTLRLFLRSPIIVLGSMIMAFAVSPRNAWIFVLVIPLLSVVVFSIMIKSIPLYKKAQQSLDKVTSVTRENLTGARVIRAFRKEQEEIDRFTVANNEHHAIQNFVARISALMNPLTLILVNMGVILILLFGAKDVQIGRLSQGEVVALTNYMAQILVELVKFANTIFTVNKALACANRIESVLETPLGMESDPTLATETGDSSIAVEFQNVGMTYSKDAEASLTGLQFQAPRGSTFGIIVSTGSGKTSLVNLIPASTMLPRGACWSTAVMSEATKPNPCGRRSPWYRKRRYCSAAPFAPISFGATIMPPTKSFGRLWRPRKPRTLFCKRKADWTPRSARTDAISPVASGSVSPLPARWYARPKF